MKQTIHTDFLDTVEEIPATEMKNAHGKRLPRILKNKGIARVTRYGKTDYVILSPERYMKLQKRAMTADQSQIIKMKARYQTLLKDIRSNESADAFDALSKISAIDLGRSVTVGSGH